MIKQLIKFEDFEGRMVEEEHYFHLGINAILKMEKMAREALGDDAPAGEDPKAAIAAWIERETDSKDSIRTLTVLGKFIEQGYGKRDGTSFTQTPEIASGFVNSLAFDAFFLGMMKGEPDVIQFVLAMMPKQLRDDPGFPKALEDVGLPKDEPQAVAVQPRLEREASADPDIDQLWEDQQSGLMRPRDPAGALLPWAFREPKPEERRKMTKPQFVDLMNRKNSGWEPIDFG